MITYTQEGSASQDCTCTFRVDLDKSYTLNEFVTELLASRPGGWGRIQVINSGLWYDYSEGVITPIVPDIIGKQEISKVTAHGCYSSMDYLIILEY